MGRRPRLEVAGAVYHVYARGNRRSEIFLCEEDYEDYLRDLRKLAKEHAVSVLAFCLMPNHPHQALRFDRDPPSVFMHRLNTRMAKRFNRRHNASGRLFEARYKAQLVDSDRYLLRLTRYIHLNPVRAGLVGSPEQWRYSSHLAYLGEKHRFVNTREVLGRLGGRQAYLEFLSAPPDGDGDRALFGGNSGELSNKFDDDGQPLVPVCGGGRIIRGPWTATRPREPIAHAAGALAAQLGVAVYQLAGPDNSATLCEARRKVALALRARGHAVAAIARLFNRDHSTVVRSLQRESLGRLSALDTVGAPDPRAPAGPARTAGTRELQGPGFEPADQFPGIR